MYIQLPESFKRGSVFGLLNVHLKVKSYTSTLKCWNAKVLATCGQTWIWIISGFSLEQNAIWFCERKKQPYILFAFGGKMLCIFDTFMQYRWVIQFYGHGVNFKTMGILLNHFCNVILTYFFSVSCHVTWSLRHALCNIYWAT